MIRFESYNICNGHNGGLEPALRRISQDNINLGVLQETKLTRGVYEQELAGLHFVALDVPSRRHDGVALFYK